MHLHLDPLAGVAGDMWLGLLVDLGLPGERLAEVPSRLGLDRVEVTTERVQRGTLAATKVHVTVDGREEAPAPDAFGSASGEPAAGGPGSSRGGGHRHLADMRELIARAGLPARAERTAAAAVQALFAAEAAVHDQPIEAVHLHEAGADDAVVDVVGTCLGLVELGVEGVSCSLPIPVGGGSIRCAHGILPVPAPAVVELLRGLEVRGGPVDRELVTPTGAALLRAVVDQFGPCPGIELSAAGAGAGGRDDPALPNVLRGVLGRRSAGALRGEVTVIETALDDALPQDVAFLVEALRRAGALDVMTQPVGMKKGRFGQLLTIVARPERERELAELLLSDSPTLGVRCRRETRYEWDRDTVSVDTPWGPVRVKRAKDESGRVLRGQPEYEDCRELAERGGVMVDRVRDAARRAFDGGAGTGGGQDPSVDL
jgi:hypothetical protein